MKKGTCGCLLSPRLARAKRWPQPAGLGGEPRPGPRISVSGQRHGASPGVAAVPGSQAPRQTACCHRGWRSGVSRAWPGRGAPRGRPLWPCTCAGRPRRPRARGSAGCACSPCSWNAPAGSPSPFPGGQGSRGRRCLPVPSLNREADTHGQTGRLPRSPRPARSPPAPTTLAERGALHLCRLPLCHRGLGRLAAEAPSAE